MKEMMSCFLNADVTQMLSKYAWKFLLMYHELAEWLNGVYDYLRVAIVNMRRIPMQVDSVPAQQELACEASFYANIHRFGALREIDKQLAWEVND